MKTDVKNEKKEIFEVEYSFEIICTYAEDPCTFEIIL
jgi:hypothetical protein